MFAQGSAVIRVEFQIHHLGYEVENGFNNAGNGRLVNTIISTWQRPKANLEKYMSVQLAQVGRLLDLLCERGEIKDTSQHSTFYNQVGDFRKQSIYIEYVGVWGRDMNSKFSDEQKIEHQEI